MLQGRGSRTSTADRVKELYWDVLALPPKGYLASRPWLS